MATQLRLGCRPCTDIGIIHFRQFLRLCDHPPGFIGIFFSHQNDRAAYSGEDILCRIDRSDFRFNSRRLQKPLDH
jgi:hypothetical protein